MGGGDPEVSGFQHSFHLRSYLSKRLLHPVVSLKHSWVSLNSAVNVSSCWIPSEINWKCCALFLLLYRKRWPTCDTWARCHCSSSLEKVTIVPSSRAGEWQASWDLGEQDPCLLHVSPPGTSCCEWLVALPLYSCSFLGILLCTGQAPLGLECRKRFICGWCSQRVLWDYRSLYFFQVIPVQLLKLCLITVLVLFM